MRKIFVLSSLVGALTLISFGVTLAQSSTQTSPEGPEVLAAVAPVYFPIARSARVNGDVVVEVKINTRGEVKDSRFISGRPLLK